MATTDTGAVGAADDPAQEVAHARRLAERYHVEFVDMEEFRINQELFRAIPADVMLRYGFVPLRREGRALVIVVSDPTDLPLIEEAGKQGVQILVSLTEDRPRPAWGDEAGLLVYHEAMEDMEPPEQDALARAVSAITRAETRYGLELLQADDKRRRRPTGPPRQRRCSTGCTRKRRARLWS